LSALPIPDPAHECTRARIVLQGDPPSPIDPPSDAASARGPKAEDICAAEEPEVIDRGAGHPVACHFADVEVVL